MAQWGGVQQGMGGMGMSAPQMGSAPGEGQRQKGTLTKWFDEKGFGFIVPENSPETEIFLHYRSVNNGIRPSGGEQVEFDASMDQQRGKVRASNVTILSGGGMGGGMGGMGGMGGGMGGGMPQQQQQQQFGGMGGMGGMQGMPQQPQGWGQPQQQMFGGGGGKGGGYGF